MELKNGAGIVQVLSLIIVIISVLFIYDNYKGNNLTKSLCSLSPGFGLTSLIITLVSSIVIFTLAMLIEGNKRYFIKGKLYDPSLMVQNIFIFTIIILLILTRNIFNDYKRVFCIYNDSLYFLVLVLLLLIFNLYKEYGRLR